MKRCSALIQLSREHHPALVLAMHAQRMNQEDREAVSKFMTQTVEIFARELEPHFQFEENHLLPAMNNVGEIELVERTLREHQQLRELANRLKAGDITQLCRFGEVLAKHVRFEERELFEMAESVLSPETLSLLTPPT